MREPFIFRFISALDGKSRAGLAAFLLLALGVVPLLHLFVPERSALHVSTHTASRTVPRHRVLAVPASVLLLAHTGGIRMSVSMPDHWSGADA